jgi:hypothetical protein
MLRAYYNSKYLSIKCIKSGNKILQGIPPYLESDALSHSNGMIAEWWLGYGYGWLWPGEQPPYSTQTMVTKFDHMPRMDVVSVAQSGRVHHCSGVKSTGTGDSPIVVHHCHRRRSLSSSSSSVIVVVHHCRRRRLL